MSVPYEQLPADVKARVRAIAPDTKPAPKDRSHRRELPDDGTQTYLCGECGLIFGRLDGKHGADRHVIAEHGGGRISIVLNPDKADP